MKKAEPKIKTQHLFRLFGVSPSSYYYQQATKDRVNQEQDLIDMIKQIHEESYSTYGRRRMQPELKSEGFAIGQFKIARLMKEQALYAKVPKKPHYYKAGVAHPKTPNLLKREFNPTTLNTRWVGDITYIRHHHGWSYLATVMDLANREIVGYALSQAPDAQLAKKSLTQAISHHKPNTKALMFHSDQGVQYSAKLFSDSLALHGISASMSRRGNCWDNAVQERFFRSLKTERLNELSFINHQSVVNAVTEYIRFYNNKRRNSVVGYLTPAMKRREMLNVA
jgi:transposase InsO family protein